MDVAKIGMFLNDILDEYAPLEGRGIGEIGGTGVAAAIASPVFNQTGKRLRDLPLTPDKLF